MTKLLINSSDFELTQDEILSKLQEEIRSLSKEEKIARLKAFDDLKALEAMEPLSRFKKNNRKQQEFLNFKNIFQFFIGGNKAGKTGTGTYKLVNICLGLEPNFPHEPPLSCWVCGETRPVLNDTVTKQITKWLRTDQYKIINVGNFVEKILITDEHGRVSELIYKPYSGGIDIFESANVHAVLADEEMPEAIFDAITPRLLENGAWFMMLMTPTHGITYVQDIIEGVGKYSGYKKYTDHLFTTIFDNAANLHPNAIEIMEASCEGNDVKRKVRMLGNFASHEGHVYDFREDIINERTGELDSWHSFDLSELPEDIFEVGRVAGFLDYGRSDSFVFVPSVLYPDGTHYFLDEIYQSNLEGEEQAIAIKELCNKWGIKPDIIVADRQIKNTLAQSSSMGSTILDIYLSVLGDSWNVFRALEKDKRDPDTARALIGDKLRKNPKTGKPSYRFSREYCRKSIKEIKRLEWSKTGAKEKTKGADDCEAGLRYYTKARVEYDNLINEQQQEFLDKKSRFRRSSPY